MSRTTNYRLGLVVAVLAVLFLVYGIGALGIIGAGGSEDRMYAVVPVVLVAGAVVARMRAAGLALALATTAAVTMLVGVVAILRGLQDTPGASVGEILMLSGMYAGLFLLSAWFFRRADGHGSTALVTRGA